MFLLGKKVFHMKDFEGKLISLASDESINVEIILNEENASKLFKAVSKGTVTKDNQTIDIETLLIDFNKDDYFSRREETATRTGNEITIRDIVCQTHKFSAFLRTVMEDANGRERFCEMQVGSISFNLSGSPVEIIGDKACYNWISANLYNHGKYSMEVYE